MQVELLLWDIIGPGIAFPVEEDPEDGQGRHPDEEDSRERDDESILAPFTRASLVFIGLIGPAALAVTKKNSN